MTEPNLTIRPAVPADAGEISEIVQEATRWLSLRAIAQWPVPWPLEWIQEKVEIGEFHCAFHDGVMAGVVRLLSTDEEMWGDTGGAAGYVHTLIVKREFAGRGFGRAILAWAEDQCRARGAEFLRLDCMASNHDLRRYYEKQGFTARGEKVVDGYRGRLYQKRIPHPTLE